MINNERRSQREVQLPATCKLMTKKDMRNQHPGEEFDTQTTGHDK